MTSGADFAVIIPAAGRSARFGGDKLAQVIAGRSILEHSVVAFLGRDDVAVIVIAARTGAEELPLDRSIASHPKLVVCAGGEHRAQSVRSALDHLSRLPGAPPFVAVHDAARPLVSQALIDRVFTAARTHGATVPGLPASDTIKRVQGGVVIQTLPRGELAAVQTPQAMRRDWLLEAFESLTLPPEQVTDDAQVLELAGRPVHLVEGDPANLKLTHPRDIERVAQLLTNQSR